MLLLLFFVVFSTLYFIVLYSLSNQFIISSFSYFFFAISVVPLSLLRDVSTSFFICYVELRVERSSFSFSINAWILARPFTISSRSCDFSFSLFGEGEPFCELNFYCVSFFNDFSNLIFFHEQFQVLLFLFTKLTIIFSYSPSFARQFLFS